MVEHASSSVEEGYLTGQLLIAMPQMADSRFAQTVIYVCAHTADGAMGLVINRQIESITFPGLLKQMEIEAPDAGNQIRVMFGGPVETGRGFVLHSQDYVQDSTLLIGGDMGLTATMDILKDMAKGAGPKQSLLALGYAGWAPGQLDHEIQANGWLHAPADEKLVFGDDIGAKWDRALGILGIDSILLSSEAGHA